MQCIIDVPALPLGMHPVASPAETTHSLQSYATGGNGGGI